MDIDYVITWVDGQDPKHVAARQQYSSDGQNAHFQATTTERYQNNGEIYYHIASIIKYAPFIRRIIIVTDNQTPKYLDTFFNEGKCDPAFIKIVSHDEIFDGVEAVRPTFNARAIEAVLWRIPGLSEHFVFGNDDFFLNAPLQVSDFFIKGLPVLHGTWTTPENKRFKYRLRHALKILGYRYTNPKHSFTLWKGAVLAGVTGNYLSVHHYTHPMRRSTLAEFFAENRQVLHQQVSHRYRDISQFNSVSLANHLEMTKYGVEVSPAKGLAYVDVVQKKHVADELEKIRQASVPFGCIQGLELFEQAEQDEILEILNAKFDDVLPHIIKDMLLHGDTRGE